MVFKDFLEYWYYARSFSTRQKDIIFNSLEKDERETLMYAWSKEKWDDVINRNILDQVVDEIREETGYDLIDIHYKVMNNESVYLPTIFWGSVLSKFEEYPDHQVGFVLGGIKAIVCKQNEHVTLLVPFYSNEKD